MAGMATFTPSLIAWRLYDDDNASEASNSAAAGVNTVLSGVSLDSGDVQHCIRLSYEDTGGAADSGGATSHILEFRINTGTWTSLGAATTGCVYTDTAGNLTDAAATTDRATDGVTDGGGTFSAGEVSTQGNAQGNFITNANGWTEILWAFTAVAADLSNGDNLEFRFLIDGTSYTPATAATITYTKASSTPVSINASGVGTASFAKAVTKDTMGVTGTGTAGITKAISKDTMAVTGTGTASITNAFVTLLSISASAVGTAVFSKIHNWVLSMSPSGVGTAVFSRVASYLRSVGASGTGTMTKVLTTSKDVMGVGATGGASIALAVTRPRSISATGVGTATLAYELVVESVTVSGDDVFDQTSAVMHPVMAPCIPRKNLYPGRWRN